MKVVEILENKKNNKVRYERLLEQYKNDSTRITFCEHKRTSIAKLENDIVQLKS
jgi:hypothetical protein